MNIRETGYSPTIMSGEAKDGNFGLDDFHGPWCQCQCHTGKTMPYSDLWFLDIVLAITFVRMGKLCACLNNRVYLIVTSLLFLFWRVYVFVCVCRGLKLRSGIFPEGRVSC